MIPFSIAIKRMSEILLYKANECTAKLNTASEVVTQVTFIVTDSDTVNDDDIANKDNNANKDDNPNDNDDCIDEKVTVGGPLIPYSCVMLDQCWCDLNIDNNMWD